MTYDVVIVGGGPSGSLLAYLLSQMGYSNLIIEKSKFPRYKTCGGGLTMKAIQQLPYDVEPVIERSASGGILTFRGKKQFRVDHKKVVAKYIMRDRFDHYLLRKAVEIGTDLIENTKIENVTYNAQLVTVQTPEGEIPSRLIIGADGVYSQTAKLLGLLNNRKTGVALEAEILVPRKTLEFQGAYALFDFGTIQNGYGWIFPKKDHFSVGVFYAKGSRVMNLKQSLDTFILNQPILNNHQIVSIKGHKIPLGGDEHVLHTSSGLVIGDAANLADPWLGEGIYYAFRSARIAAEEIDNLLNNKTNSLENYSRRINSEIIKQFKIARGLSNIVYRYPQKLSVILSKSPIMQRAIFDTIRGDINFRQLRGRLIRNIHNIYLEVERNKERTK